MSAEKSQTRRPAVALTPKEERQERNKKLKSSLKPSKEKKRKVNSQPSLLPPAKAPTLKSEYENMTELEILKLLRRAFNAAQYLAEQREYKENNFAKMAGIDMTRYTILSSEIDALIWATVVVAGIYNGDIDPVAYFTGKSFLYDFSGDEDK